MADNSSSSQYFAEYQRYLTGVAYRMLGSVHDAEEVVQETFLRYESSGQIVLEAPKVWFTRVCTRICLDRIKRLSTRREQYPGQWLPEPFIESEDQVTIDETLSMALMIGLSSLSSKERAVFLLHDIFDYNFNEIAATLELTTASCRQLAVRARRQIRQARSSQRPAASELDRITQTFLQAIRDGDAAALQQVLAEDVRLLSDGGGKVSAVPYPLSGRDKVHTFLMRIYLPYQNGKPLIVRACWFNGAPGLLMESAGEAASALQLDIEAGRIRSIFVQRNPDKLRRLMLS
ncbi:MAG: RNA polymerase sigma factor SigJ [Planctomycetales bacterium]|nr:RNA polymerase sigma factor SigJ [Planctomycetales bacterium]